MILWGCSWFLWDSEENTTPFQCIMAADPHLCHTHFAPTGLYAEGHMLEVVIVEKDTLEVRGSWFWIAWMRNDFSTCDILAVA